MTPTIALLRNPAILIPVLLALAVVTVMLLRMGVPAHHVLGARSYTFYYE